MELSSWDQIEEVFSSAAPGDWLQEHRYALPGIFTEMDAVRSDEFGTMFDHACQVVNAAAPGNAETVVVAALYCHQSLPGGNPIVTADMALAWLLRAGAPAQVAIRIAATLIRASVGQEAAAGYVFDVLNNIMGITMVTDITAVNDITDITEGDGGQ